MSTRLDPAVELSMKHGFALAAENRHEYFTLEHLLFGALHMPEIVDMFKTFQVDPEKLKKELANQLTSYNNTLRADPSASPATTVAFNRVLQRSVRLAQDKSAESVRLWMVMLNILLEEDSFAKFVLERHGIKSVNIKSYVSHHQGAPAASTSAGDQSSSGPSESALAKYGINLNERALANKIDPLIGRSYEIERTAQILSRRRKNNPLLVGEPGVGKTAIAEGLAKMIVEKNVPDSLEGKTVWSLNLGAMVAGTKYRGDFEQRIKDVLDEVAKNDDVILFIDEIHSLIGAGATGGGSMDASNIIKPALASGDLRVIGATTFQEYREIFEKEKALDRRFQKVDVVEPSPADTVAILKGLRKSLEEHHGVKFTTDAIQSAVDLSIKYIPDRFLPDKAIDVLDEAGAAERLRAKKDRHKFIDRDLIEQTIAKITRIPVTQVSKTEKDNLKTLATDLRAVVFGQDEAIEKLSSAVYMAKAGLNDGEKPLGSFLFAGPTGVGKTEIARQLSKNLGIPLVRFDMSEYMEQHSVARLIGAPPGYVGHDKGGLLTDAIFKNPHCVLLLDEIEKAHPDVYNLLLQVMDHGSLTDANGRTVNFKNTFVILTTNAGAQAAAKASMGFLKSDNVSEGKKVLDSTFAPEFRNRLDAIVSFQALGPNEISKIVDKNIRALEVHLRDKNVTLDVSDEARAALAKEGYVPAMGARPMARVVQERLKRPLSEKILFGDLQEGGHVYVTVDANGAWALTTMPLPKAVASRKNDDSVRSDLDAIEAGSETELVAPAAKKPRRSRAVKAKVTDPALGDQGVARSAKKSRKPSA